MICLTATHKKIYAKLVTSLQIILVKNVITLVNHAQDSLINVHPAMHKVFFLFYWQIILAQMSVLLELFLLATVASHVDMVVNNAVKLNAYNVIMYRSFWEEDVPHVVL